MAVSGKQEYLFVYGTLMRCLGHPRSDTLNRHARLLGSAEIQGRMYEVNNYPGVVLSSAPSDRVKGELYLLHDSELVFSKLDRFEGYFPDNPDGSMYIRKKIKVWYQGKEKLIDAWIYIFNRPTHTLTLIQSGDYQSFVRKDSGQSH